MPDSATRAAADAAHSENGGYCDVAAMSEKADAVGDRGDLLVLHTLLIAPLGDPEAQRQLVLAVPRSRKRSPAARRARKFDWLAWWAGRQWGPGIIRIFTTSDRAQRHAARATEQNPWIVRLAVVIAVLPGIPTGVVYAAAGWARMRLSTFLLLDLLGAVLMTAVIAGLGYGLGQRAVDVVLTIDRYASAVSLTMITVALLIPVIKRRIQRKSTPVED